MPRILFVSGFHPATRARDLAYEFERYVRSSLSLNDLAQTEFLSQLRPSNSLRRSRSSQSLGTL